MYSCTIRMYCHVLELSGAHRNFAKTLGEFKFDTIGSTQTDDERAVGE